MGRCADHEIRRKRRGERPREERALALGTRGGWRGALALWGRAGTPPFFAAFRDGSDR